MRGVIDLLFDFDLVVFLRVLYKIAASQQVRTQFSDFSDMLTCECCAFLELVQARIGLSAVF